MHKFHHGRAASLESDERRKLIPPEETLRRLGVKKDMFVADVGAGTGYFSRAAAAIVGAKGRVFAVEMSEEMIAAFRSYGVPENVEIVRSEESANPLPDATADVTFAAFVTHEAADLPRFLAEARRITKPDGRLVIVEWKKQSEEKGPDEQERLAQADLVDALGKDTVVEVGDLNASHYFVISRV